MVFVAGVKYYLTMVYQQAFVWFQDDFAHVLFEQE